PNFLAIRSLDNSPPRKVHSRLLHSGRFPIPSGPESTAFVAMDVTNHDVLLVGGGGAGLRAAIAVSEVNPKLHVAVVSKVYPMRSHTVSAEGGAAGVAKPGDTLDEHAYDPISGGDWLCYQDAVDAIELMSGKIQAITAKAVILCTGGCGRVFPFTTNASIKTGDGMGLAYRAGAPLKDMEFIQYHPTGLPFTGILITEAARSEGGYLVNKDGYRYLQDYNLGTPQPKPVLRSMELGPRDRLSQAFVKEQQKGRTIDGPYGPVVHLDLRHLGEKLINTKLPFVRELCTKYQNVDPVKELVPVRPVIHYMMGGVSTDINGATPLAGLYAAGEVACVSINGANRLGSN